MRFDAVLFDNGGTLTHRTSPVAAVRALAARLGVEIAEEEAARYWRRSKEHSRTLMAEKRRRRNLSRADHRAAYVHRRTRRSTRSRPGWPTSCTTSGRPTRRRWCRIRTPRRC